MLDKIADQKLTKSCYDCLEAFSENTSLSLVVGQSLECLAQQKSPKVLSEFTNYLQKLMDVFGVSGLPVKRLVDYLQTLLGHSNLPVRNSAVGAAARLASYGGEGILSLFSGLSPAIRDEYEKSLASKNSGPFKPQKVC